MSTPTIPPRFDVTEDQIARVVAAFYASIRQHPGLGPVFANHVTDWPAHERRIADFWSDSILHTRKFSGNPFKTHKDAGDIRPGMFTPWLALFDATLVRELPPAEAAAWSALAHKIGRSLRAGVSDVPRKGAPPILR